MYFLDKAVAFLPQHARFDTLSDAHKAGFQGF